jgi:hypothetical protein
VWFEFELMGFAHTWTHGFGIYKPINSFQLASYEVSEAFLRAKSLRHSVEYR